MEKNMDLKLILPTKKYYDQIAKYKQDFLMQVQALTGQIL